MSAAKSTVSLGRALALVEGSLDPREHVSDEMRRMGIPHRFETGGKHNFLVYRLGDKEHRFPISHGHKRDGAIRHVIVTAVRRHVRAARNAK